jgi:acetolactate synthase I/II/III large subunit
VSTESTQEIETFHGGRLIARRLRAHGVSKLFTLSGGHLFSIYDGCREEGIEIVDVRHESTAAFAAEGWAKVTREPGVCALTAGPGVTNGMSAMASAQANHSPIVVLGGRAPAMRWGQGSLQEIDHVPFVRPLSKLAATAGGTEEISGLVDLAFQASVAPHGGPTFVDFPLDYVFMEAREEEPAVAEVIAERASGASIEQAGELLREAERPVIMAGTDLYWGHGEEALLELAQTLRIPVFLNGLARGCVPADHELFFSRARSQGLQGADVALVVGVPMDFRLGFGAAFGEQTEIVVVDAAEPERPHPRVVAAECYGSLSATLEDLRAAAGAQALPSERWVSELQAVETERRAAERAEREDDRSPLHPMRLYAELATVLDRNAIVIGDGGDFVSYAGRVIDSYEPGCWLDPGPFGCLGTGPGYALAATRRERGRRDGQQWHLGAREAPDGVPLRLLGRRRAAPGHQVRRGRRGARLSRRARRARAGCGSGDRACFLIRPAGAGERAHRSEGGLPAQVEPRLRRTSRGQPTPASRRAPP